MSQRERRVGVGRQEGSSSSLSWLGGGGGGTFIFIPSRLLSVGYRAVVLFVCNCISVDGSCLSGVGCRILTVDCRVSLPVVDVGSWMSGIGCRALVVDCLCRLSLSFSTVGSRENLKIYRGPSFLVVV
jgi:hypothetical protein